MRPVREQGHHGTRVQRLQPVPSCRLPGGRDRGLRSRHMAGVWGGVCLGSSTHRPAPSEPLPQASLPLVWDVKTWGQGCGVLGVTRVGPVC